jgi:hypothetical protein
MNTNDLTRGAAIVAAATAMLLAQGCGSKDEDESPGTANAQIKCFGANACAGMSECAGGSGMSSCKGLNECMGQGWVYTATEEACAEKGGTPQA